MKKKRINRRNFAAKALQSSLYRQRVKPSGKQYARKKKVESHEEDYDTFPSRPRFRR